MKGRRRRGCVFPFLLAVGVALLVPCCGHLGLYFGALTVLCAGAAFWASLKIVERQRGLLYRLLKAPWFYTSTGLGLWLTAETVRLAHLALMGYLFKPSPADAVWVLGYIFLLIGLYRCANPLSSLARNAGLGGKLWIARAIPLALSVPLVAAVLVSSHEAAAGGLWAVIAANAMRVAMDLVLLTFSLEEMVVFYGGKMARSLALFSLGLAVMALSDLPYSVVGGYWPGNPLDALRVASYALMALGIYSYSKQPLVV